ncbi:uncharacterized protein LOC121640613 isoform X2 [Melanotaenia boesemani]|uniref:uncharacterized protein LOC121640613 isoform X1 n=1 Tax=Melanotaenia boesemani TaxID=1250792 RepID=UPI001C03E55B|nr:uncharacterized protein LOC121640613 isoform X1 [Melanotaenia boesemani]XP_041842319.1 uncharacterized protein LOC121640613 isoform X2 [Melanotaenia boesemani]
MAGGRRNGLASLWLSGIVSPTGFTLHISSVATSSAASHSSARVFSPSAAISSMVNVPSVATSSAASHIGAQVLPNSAASHASTQVFSPCVATSSMVHISSILFSSSLWSATPRGLLLLCLLGFLPTRTLHLLCFWRQDLSLNGCCRVPQRSSSCLHNLPAVLRKPSLLSSRPLSRPPEASLLSAQPPKLCHPDCLPGPRPSSRPPLPTLLGLPFFFGLCGPSSCWLLGRGYCQLLLYAQL